jgi:hypothetical protein
MYDGDKMANEKKEVRINCTLSGQVAEKFQAIKDFTNLTNKTEIIRLVLSDFYKSHIKGES